MSATKKLTIVGHLVEFRRRLLWMLLAVGIASGIAFIFADQIFRFLTIPVKENQLVFIDMTEMLGVYMKVCLAAGIFLAMPFLAYQAVMFIAPALNPAEKKYVFLIVPWVFLMFVAGAAFSFFVLLPPAMRFLFNFGSDIVSPQIRIGSYIAVVTRIVIATGIIFELPVISTFFARLGVITPEWLAGKRKAAVISTFVLAALITPTVDPVSQSVVALPLILLYETSIWLAKLVRRQQPKVITAVVTRAS